MNSAPTVRVRFAPSPTGHLHIGGGRTALFNFLFAKHHGGKFILRIEDTDKERSTAESTQGILDGMRWLGLNWDEGPYYQAQRLPLHAAAVETLRKNGFTYPCYCTPEELDAARKAAEASGKAPGYPGTCRDLKAPLPGKEHVKPCTRLRVPKEGTVEFTDLIAGPLKFEGSGIDDLVLLRSDGTPTYNLSVVVDDIDMGITHVVRGDDHISNTPKQIVIYRGLGKQPPQFAHLPMILGPDRKKLSKRNGVPNILVYRDMGYLPHAVVNYLVRLGWSHGDQEIFSLDELIQNFSFEHVGSSPSALDVNKLDWLNGHYLRESKAADLWPEIQRLLRERGVQPRLDEARCLHLVTVLKERAKTLVEIAELCEPFFVKDPNYQAADVAKHLTAEARPLLTELRASLHGISTWKADDLKPAFEAVAQKYGVKFVKLAQPVRVSLTGSSISPGIYDVAEILGREETLRRLDLGLAKISG